MRHLDRSYRIWIYDPGHFTPYYNAGLCGQFAAMGFPCTLITSPATFEPVAAEDGYDVSFQFFKFMQGPLGKMLRHRPWMRKAAKALAYPAGVWRTFRTLRLQEPGVFHIHFCVMPVLDWLLARALRGRGWQVVYTLQAPHPQGAWNRWQYGRVVHCCDVVVMHSEALAARLREIYPESAKKIFTQTHGVDLPALPAAKQRDEARAALGVASDDLLLLFFGMLKPYKGLEDLLDAMPAVLARAPRTRLCIAGEPLMNMRGVEERIARLPAGTVIPHFQFVPQAEVERYFAAADLVVTCYREIAASAVVLQAQAFGRPVLATRVGALPALLDDGRCGFLAGEDLAESIAAVLADPEGREEIGRRGREHAEKGHSWEAVARETLRLYGIREEAGAGRRP